MQFLDYTDFWYDYQPVRHCTPSLAYCDSKFYFCDHKKWRCRSRVQLGGNCTGFENTEICYNSVCIQVSSLKKPETSRFLEHMSQDHD